MITVEDAIRINAEDNRRVRPRMSARQLQENVGTALAVLGILVLILILR